MVVSDSDMEMSSPETRDTEYSRENGITKETPGDSKQRMNGIREIKKEIVSPKVKVASTGGGAKKSDADDGSKIKVENGTGSLNGDSEHDKKSVLPKVEGDDVGVKDEPKPKEEVVDPEVVAAKSEVGNC